jgi:hypothetical protein
MFSRNSVLQRKCLPQNSSKSMGSDVRLKTYLVQVNLLYTSVILMIAALQEAEKN